MDGTQPDVLAATNGIATPSDLIVQLNQRIIELERQLAVMSRERDEFKAAAYQLSAQLHPVDLSEDWLNDPPGKPLTETVAEYFATRQG